jgi:hypothetical protein
MNAIEARTKAQAALQILRRTESRFGAAGPQGPAARNAACVFSNTLDARQCSDADIALCFKSNLEDASPPTRSLGPGIPPMPGLFCEALQLSIPFPILT